MTLLAEEVTPSPDVWDDLRRKDEADKAAAVERRRQMDRWHFTRETGWQRDPEPEP